MALPYSTPDPDLDLIVEMVVGRPLPRLGECVLGTGMRMHRNGPLPYPITAGRLSVRRSIFEAWYGTEIGTHRSIAPLVCGLLLCVTPWHQTRLRRGFGVVNLERAAELIDERAGTVGSGLGLLTCAACELPLSGHLLPSPCLPESSDRSDRTTARHLHAVI